MQPPEVFYKKGVLKNVTKFTVKHLCQKCSLFLNKAYGNGNEKLSVWWYLRVKGFLALKSIAANKIAYILSSEKYLMWNLAFTTRWEKLFSF